jgi:hypothetical protein
MEFVVKAEVVDVRLPPIFQEVVGVDGRYAFGSREFSQSVFGRDVAHTRVNVQFATHGSLL